MTETIIIFPLGINLIDFDKEQPAYPKWEKILTLRGTSLILSQMGKIISNLQIHTPADLGQAIRAARKRHGLNLVSCAAANGVSVRFLSELERGKSGASLGAALKIARSVGLHLFVEDAS